MPRKPGEALTKWSTWYQYTLKLTFLLYTPNVGVLCKEEQARQSEVFGKAQKSPRR